MKRKLITATMAAMMMVSSAVPALAVVGAPKPDSPDRMVITSIRHDAEGATPEKPIPPVAEKRIAPVENKIMPVKAPMEGETLPAREGAPGTSKMIPPTGPVLDEERVPMEEVADVEQGDKRWYLTKQEPIGECTTGLNNYTVQKGDTLWKIAQKQLKTEDAIQIRKGMEQIIQANQLQLQNPDLIFVGDMLSMPKGL